MELLHTLKRAFERRTAKRSRSYADYCLASSTIAYTRMPQPRPGNSTNKHLRTSEAPAAAEEKHPPTPERVYEVMTLTQRPSTQPSREHEELVAAQANLTAALLATRRALGHAARRERELATRIRHLESALIQFCPAETTV